MNTNSLSREESLTESIYFAQLDPIEYKRMCARIATNVFSDKKIQSVLTTGTNAQVKNFLFDLSTIVGQEAYFFSELIELNRAWVKLIGSYQMISEDYAHISQDLLDILYYAHESLIDDPRKSTVWLAKAAFRLAENAAIDATHWLSPELLSVLSSN